MGTVNVDLWETVGKIKPMHAVNNGPVYKFGEDQRITNLKAYRAAGIPFARTHDASFCAEYGGEHIVDVHAIFPDFEKDPYDPASYDFTLTDEYLKVIRLAGTEPFYRLGSKIEHWSKKYGTLPPKDFKKWAVICEHIIKHYNCGWADGYQMNIRYWEIWNEPDLDSDDATHKRCWGGTKAEFFAFYDVAASHLKEKFPELKIGGPALAYNLAWAEEFLAQLKAPLDFFSWHIYADDPKKIAEKAGAVRKLLDENGFLHTESILNEWNYVQGWDGEAWYQSLKAEKSMKGAAFVAGAMCACQKAALDLLMYYDARPCAMNGMFNTDFVCECLKGYYPFKTFHALYALGDEVRSASAEDIFVCAARQKDKAAIMVTRCSEDTKPKTVRLTVSGAKGAAVSYYLLDETHDLTLVRQERVDGGELDVELEFMPDAMYLIELTGVETRKISG